MKHLIAILIALTQPHHPMTRISQYCGDSRTHAISLTWDGAAFSPGTDWNLIWTAKLSAADDDAHALVQKASGAGITLTGSTAYVAIVPQDTAALGTGEIVWDIQAQNNSTGEVRTLADGRLSLIRDVTRLTRPSIPIYLADPNPATINSSQIADALQRGVGNSQGKAVLYGEVGRLNATAFFVGDPHGESTQYNMNQWASIQMVNGTLRGFFVNMPALTVEADQYVTFPQADGIIGILNPYPDNASALEAGATPGDIIWDTTRNCARLVTE